MRALFIKRLCVFACAAILSAILFGAAQAASAQDAEPVPSDMRPAVIAPDLPDDGPVRNDMDVYGGWKGLAGKKTGFFHVEQLGGRWWFVTPEGNAYFLLQMGWADKGTGPRLKSWGFNCAEAESGLPYVVDVRFFRELNTPFPIEHSPFYPPWMTFPDVFDPAWPKICEEQAKRVLGSTVNDPLLVGYFLENEICQDGWYEAVLRSGKDAPCRKAFVEVARKYYADKPDDFAKDWKDLGLAKIDDIMNAEGAAPKVPGLVSAWLSAVAERAYSIPVAAAKAVDPNHLCLGVRLANAPLPPMEILGAMGKYFDVISMNLYNMHPDRVLSHVFTLIPALNAMTGRPTITTEFSFRGGDTAHPNTMGALPTVKTQADRAIGYMSYVAALASIPSHIGVAWYKYPDDNTKGAWDDYSEDCNFGTVDLSNRPYAVLTEAMKTTNSIIYELAADPVKSANCPLFWRTELTRWDRPGDELLFQRIMRSDAPFVDPLAGALPEPRRYHANYWIHHEDPKIVINDDRFVGWCQANIAKQDESGAELVLIDVQALTTFPRSLWLGKQCDNPDAPLTLESNAQYLDRKIDASGRLARLTIADGSYARTDYATMEIRTDVRVPYIDLRFNQDAKELAVTSRGAVNHMGVAGVEGWKVVWNGAALSDSQIAQANGMTSITPPSQQ
jgi:agarase